MCGITITSILSPSFFLSFFSFFWAEEAHIFRVSYSILAHKPMIFTLLFISRQAEHANFDLVASCIGFKFNPTNQLERWTSGLWRAFIAQIMWLRSYNFVHLPLVGRKLIKNRNKHKNKLLNVTYSKIHYIFQPMPNTMLL